MTVKQPVNVITLVKRPLPGRGQSRSTLLAISDVNSVTIYGQSCFMQRLRKGRMGENHHSQVFGTGTELHANGARPDQ